MQLSMGRVSQTRSRVRRFAPVFLLGGLLQVATFGCGSDGDEAPPPGGGSCQVSLDPNAPPNLACATFPQPTPGQNLVQFVNQSDTTLLLAAFGPTAVLPREKTWVLDPGKSLIVDIPKEWKDTRGEGKAGPRFWARTGCRYDASKNIAQCETGDWGGNYDAFLGTLRPFPVGISPNTFTEWCFNCGNNFTYWDVSAVDGADISVDIQPLGTYSDKNPLAPGDAFWCKYPNSITGEDLRDTMNCPKDYQLKRSQLKTYVVGSEDEVIACFSNCGKLKYPLEPPQDCTDQTDSRCSAWKRYCCTAGAAEYSKMCTSDADCSFGNGCLELVDREGHPIKLCQCRGWIANPPCPDNVCTNQDAGVPPFGTCSQAAGQFQCVGEDTIHQVLPRAFSWPNDPQTYDCDASIYRVTFAPGGTSVPISKSGPILNCKDLPAPAYDYEGARNICSGVANKVFAGARPAPQSWSCKVDGPVDAVLCRW